MKLIYFSFVRERIGKAEEEISLPDAIETVSDLLSFLADQGEGYQNAFEDLSRLRTAVNQTLVPITHPIKDADEVAIFPPVTGG